MSVCKDSSLNVFTCFFQLDRESLSVFNEYKYSISSKKREPDFSVRDKEGQSGQRNVEFVDNVDNDVKEFLERSGERRKIKEKSKNRKFCGKLM